MDKEFDSIYDKRRCFIDQIWMQKFGEISNTVLDESHKMRYSIHPGSDMMYLDLKKSYWWSYMKVEITTNVNKFLTYAMVKVEYQKPSALLQQPEIPEWKLDQISMDLITKPLNPSNVYDTIWVVVDCQTKSANFLRIKETYQMKKLAKTYIKGIVRLHGLLISIISDRDSKFTSQFCQSLQQALRTHLDISITYDPQTDGQSERTIQTIKDIFQAYSIDFRDAWDTHPTLG